MHNPKLPNIQTVLLPTVSRYKLVTINLSSFSLNTHDEPICVSRQLSSLVFIPSHAVRPASLLLLLCILTCTPQPGIICHNDTNTHYQ